MSEKLSIQPSLKCARPASARCATASLTVVENVNWSVRPGEFWVVAGQQQSGKSDLLMTPPGCCCRRAEAAACSAARRIRSAKAQLAERLRVGFVFAGGKLFSQLTVAENVALAACATRKIFPPRGRAAVAKPAGNAGADAVRRFHASQSRGQLAAARGARRGRLIFKPELLLLDSPLGGLDARHRQWLLQFLDQLWRGHEWFGGRPLTLVVPTDDLRAWRIPSENSPCWTKKLFPCSARGAKLNPPPSPRRKRIAGRAGRRNHVTSINLCRCKI
jgi:ABC-type lipoprotein export system ATPase subunit